MRDTIRHLDQQFSAFRSLKNTTRPAKGWIRALRDALGMTTAQLGKRMGVSQPRAVAIEKGEIGRSITLKSLDRAAEALGCRVVYLLIPERPLEEVVRARAEQIADAQLATLGKTMQLEDQAVRDPKARRVMRDKLVEELTNEPATLWETKW